MTLYLDASVLVSLLTEDSLTPRAYQLLRTQGGVLIVSDLGAAEFASVIARLVRTRNITATQATDAFALLDDWSSRKTERVHVTPVDIRFADTALRRLDLTLRTADAIHIAIARRLDATLATFDVKMAACARTLGVTVAA